MLRETRFFLHVFSNFCLILSQGNNRHKFTCHNRNKNNRMIPVARLKILELSILLLCYSVCVSMLVKSIKNK